MTIYDILKDTSYKTEQFSNDAIDRLNERLVEKEDKNGKKYAVVNCLVRKKDIRLNPEEVVRQLFVDKLINLALKEILDGNINFFLEKTNVKKILYALAWDELLKKQEIYIPNFNENHNNGDLKVVIVEYAVDDIFIKVKARITLDYWYDAYSMKRMHAMCNASIARDAGQADKFKMVFEKLTDLPKGD